MFWGIIIGLVIGGVIGYLIAPKGKRVVNTTQYANESAAQKAANMQKIMEFIKERDRFANDDLEKLLGISNTTVGRYLDELEASNKITQVGETGKYVYYTKK